MATIPQYNRSVAPQNTPLQYIQTNANENTFGAGVARAAQGMGEAAMNLADGIASLKAQYDKTKLFEFSNNIDTWSNDNLYNKDKGYFVKTGKEAMGKSPEIMESYDKYIDKYISEAGFMGGWAMQARRIAQDKRNNIERLVENHDKQQSDSWQDAVYTDAMSNVLNKGIQGRNNDADIARGLIDGHTLLANYGQIKGWGNDAQMSEIKTKEFESAYLSKILDAYLAEGSLKSRAFFEKYKDKFSPDIQTQYMQRIHGEEVDYTARTTAQMLIGKTPEEAYKYIDKIQNIQVRNATENEYNRLLRHQDEIQRQNDIKASNEIMQKVFVAYENGGDISSIMREINVSNMSLDQKEKIYKNLKDMQELEGAGNNWADYNYLLDMAAYNNEDFKTINPASYRLTKEQYNSVVEMQRKAVNNEYTPEAEMKKAIDNLGGFNVFQTNNGLKKSEYENEVIKFLEKVERMQGQAFDLKNKTQLNSIIEGFNYKDPNAVNKNIDETRELFARAKKHGEVYDIMAREYMLFKGQNKREPSPQEIFEMAKRSYNTVENNWKQRDLGKLNQNQGIYKNVSATNAKKGETKVLTYYADTRIPQISRELGIPLQITSRYRAGDNGGHGKGRKCDIGMAALNVSQRMKVFERLISDPAIASIGTSDPILLKRYNSPANPKIRDLREYDTNYRKAHPNTSMNHVNHIDISFDTRYGGEAQGK